MCGKQERGGDLLKRTDEIDEILKQFPFYRRNRERQVRVLFKFLVESLGLSQVDTAAKLGVSRETVKQIQESWNHLDDEERVLLIQFLRDQYVRSSSQLRNEDFLSD